MSGDSVGLTGKIFFVGTLSASVVTNIGPFNPTFFGARAAAFGTFFANWRVKKLMIKAWVNSTLAAVPLGILDDSSGAEGDAPTTNEGIMQLRSSMVVLPPTGPAVVLEYSPVDKRKWYYTFAGATGSDPRLYEPGTMFGGLSSTPITIQIDFSLSFKGAVDTQTT